MNQPSPADSSAHNILQRTRGALNHAFRLVSPKSGSDPDRAYLGTFLAACAIFAVLLAGALIPYSFWWIHASGDLALERAVAAQAGGDHVLFGPAISQDFTTYKLALYDKARPEIVALGSSRVMQFRQAWFREKFINMGGAVGNISMLRYVVDAMLEEHRPRVVIIGIDFWWFLPQWEKEPHRRQDRPVNGYAWSLAALKKPWSWFFEGKISVPEFLAPWLGWFGHGFRADRLGIMAQQTSDGFGPDGAWNYTAQVTGQRPPFDYQFSDTLEQARLGIKAFYHSSESQAGPARRHLDEFAQIWCSLRARGVQTYVFIPPLSPPVFDALQANASNYTHLFNLRSQLQERGIQVLDFSNPRRLPSSACEFIDGFHGGEITYARILQQLCDAWPALLNYVNMEKLDTLIRDFPDHAAVPNPAITSLPLADFMDFGCPARKGKQ